MYFQYLNINEILEKQDSTSETIYLYSWIPYHLPTHLLQTILCSSVNHVAPLSGRPSTFFTTANCCARCAAESARRPCTKNASSFVPPSMDVKLLVCYCKPYGENSCMYYCIFIIFDLHFVRSCTCYGSSFFFVVLKGREVQQRHLKDKRKNK